VQLQCKLAAVTPRIHVDSALGHLDVQLVENLLITKCLDKLCTADFRPEWLTVRKLRRLA
jgi:hypothetical protein